MTMRDYDGIEFKNISDENSSELSDEEKNKLDELVANNKELLDNMKEALKDKVDEVSFSTKLVDSPVCISTKNGVSMNMEKIVNEMPDGNEQRIKASKVLEINPDHPLFEAIKTLGSSKEELTDYALMLYDEALLLEGHEIKDKEKFASRLNKIIVESLKSKK